MMTDLQIIKRLAELGALTPVNIVIKESDKYYDIDYITYDNVIDEVIIVAKDGTSSNYSSRGDII